MTRDESQAFMYVVGTARNFATAGDALATMLGYALASLEAREEFGPVRLEAARQGILAWRQLKQQAGSTLGGT